MRTRSARRIVGPVRYALPAVISGSRNGAPPRSALDDAAVAHAPDATRLAIRCRPRAPVAADDLEHWLTQLVDELRGELPQLVPGISRLTQSPGSDDPNQGWLLELELPAEDVGCVKQVENALRDMRLLGLEATLLAPHQLSQPEAHRRDSAIPPTEE